MTILNKISLDQLHQVQQSIIKATGLPNAAYTDSELFEFERDHIIGKTWAGLEFASSVPEAGYAFPIDFMGLPLVVIRGRDDEVKVYHNVCSHRGMVLVQEPGPVKNLIRCPYHSWSYDLKGSLKSTPHIGGVGKHTVEGFDCKDRGLSEVRSQIWMGMIFINLSGDACEFGEYIGPLVSRWESLAGDGALDKVQPAESYSRRDIKIKSNWKFAVENYCEAYHLPWVHPDLNSYSPLEEHENLHVNEYMTGQATLNYTLAEVSGHTLPKFPEWPEPRHSYGEYISLYPNVLLGLQVDHVFAIILQPKSPGKTLEKLELSYINDDARSDEWLGCRKAVMQAWMTVFEEDIFAVEGMQRGRQSRAYTGGAFSPVLDAPAHEFHVWVAKNYTRAIEDQVSRIG